MKSAIWFIIVVSLIGGLLTAALSDGRLSHPESAYTLILMFFGGIFTTALLVVNDSQCINQFLTILRAQVCYGKEVYDKAYVQMRRGLFGAVEHDNADLVEFCLERFQYDSGELEIAWRSAITRFNSANQMANFSILETLLKTRPELLDSPGFLNKETALMCAARRKEPALVHWLRSHKASETIENTEGKVFAELLTLEERESFRRPVAVVSKPPTSQLEQDTTTPDNARERRRQDTLSPEQLRNK